MLIFTVLFNSSPNLPQPRLVPVVRAVGGNRDSSSPDGLLSHLWKPYSASPLLALPWAASLGSLLSSFVEAAPQRQWWQLLSHSVVSDSATPWTATRLASLNFIVSWSLPKLISVQSVMPSNHLILCCPLLLLPSIFPSIRGFSSESALHIRWPKYWSFSFNISPSNKYSRLISFRMDCLDLLAAQGTLKSLLQHHSSKASILWPSPFFLVQLSHPYMTTGKTIALTVWTFVGKEMAETYAVNATLCHCRIPGWKSIEC